MAKVELKKPVVEEISEVIKDAQGLVLVDYRGLTVEQDTILRKQLREAGITYKVFKNTMMNFAFKGTDFEALSPHLEGPSAIAVSKDDATAPARVIVKFAKDAPQLELLGSLQSPISNLARVLNQIAQNGGGESAKEAEAPAAEAPAEEAAPAAEAEAEAPAAEAPAEEAAE